MAKKSPLKFTAEEMEGHVNSIREAVASFLRVSGVIAPKFSDLVDYMNTMFNTVDEEMFKAWTEKEFPGQIVYSHTLPATYDGDENEEDVVD